MRICTCQMESLREIFFFKQLFCMLVVSLFEQIETRTIEMILMCSLLMHCTDWVSLWGGWYSYCFIVWTMDKKNEPHFMLGSFRNLAISCIKNTEICNHNGFKFEFTLLIEEVRCMYRLKCVPPPPSPGDWTQALRHTRQAFYYLAMNSAWRQCLDSI